jgi:hypothetical protein
MVKEQKKGFSPKEALEAFNWDTLPAATQVEYSRNEAGVSRETVEATTPDVIKTRLADSYKSYVETYNSDEWEDDVSDAYKRTKANESAFREQSFPTTVMAEHFVKLARRYATSQGWTLRGKFVKETTFRFFVKPGEKRTRRAA